MHAAKFVCTSTTCKWCINQGHSAEGYFHQLAKKDYGKTMNTLGHVQDTQQLVTLAATYYT